MVMLTEAFHKIPALAFVAPVVTILICAVTFGLLRDFIVFILSKMYEFFIQRN